MADEIQALQLADFMDIFAGNVTNYGVHNYIFSDKGKENGKNHTVTDTLLTIEQYRNHLGGNVGLGIIPLDANGEAKFGVIDIDVYDSDLNMYIKAIENSSFPLIPFKSKSGGLHIYLFLKQAVSARLLIDTLSEMVMILGLDLYIKRKLNRIIEIFPKQAKTSNGSIGNWINLPYYNVKETRQYAIRDGKELGLNDALAYIKSKRKTIEDVKSFMSELPYCNSPPCLQTVNILNIMDENSGRNNYLFSFGVFLKKSNPEFWEQKLFELNSLLSNPLPKAELEATVVNSLRKKDYTYKCNDAPCCDYCRKPICKNREYGIGKEGGYFSELEFGKLMQVNSYEPYYEWEVKIIGDEKFKTLRFKSEADIIGQDAFLRLCFRELHLLPIKMKLSEWFKLINQALSDMEVVTVEKEDDTTPIGLFKSMFIEFLTDRAMAQTKEQIFNKRVFYDAHTNRYYFRTADLSDYIFIARAFRYYAPGELHGILKDFKAVATRIKTESGRQLRVYEIAKNDLLNLGNIQTDTFEAKFENETVEF